MEQTSQTIPIPFIWRRLHSLTGLFLTLFLIEHLFVNSQASLLIGDDGWGFVKAVNGIHDLPYLPLIEIFLLGVPILLHMILGVQYLRTAEQNAYGNPGNQPYLPEYPRNKAYTWQRITSWILLVGIIAHVVHMRFVEYPEAVSKGAEKEYRVKLNHDRGLESLSQRLGFKVLPPDQTQSAALSPGEVIAVTKSFGMAELLIVRDTFKMPFMIALYTIFVLAASFHGFNGLWTFMISWGVTLSEKSQKGMLRVAQFLMISIAFLGLAAIWGTYWINLKY
jgi:succinate dehydrogenase / fumarate reductase, cytochrome b subunit